MDYYADIGVTILIYVVLGVSLNLLLGYAGEVSMAHAVFYGIGAYTAGLLTLPAIEGLGAAARGVISGQGWNWLPALVVAVAVSFVFAFLISLPAAFRVHGEYLILLTLAFQIVANQLMSSLRDVTGGPYGLTPIPPIDFLGTLLIEPTKMFWFMLVVAAGVCAVAWGLGESPFGRLLKGIREDEVAVRALGKNTVRAKVVVFGVAAAMAGMAGALAAYYYQFIAPGNYSLDLSIFVVAIVVLGGAGNLTGTIVGAILLGVLRPLLEKIVGDDAIPWQGVIYGLALVAIMFFRPEGVVPEGKGVSALARRLLPTRARRPASVESDTFKIEPLQRQGGPRPDGGGGPAGAGAGRPILDVRGLSKRFDGIRAVDDVDLTLRRGAITALLGPNGAGKTTIFNLITGVLKPDSGKVYLEGRDITGQSLVRIARHGMARSFQDVRVFQRLSVLENVAVAVPYQPGESVAMLALRPIRSRKIDRHAREKALRALDFVRLRDRAYDRAADLSFGEQKLVALARLLATEAEVLLLDEPTSGVDPNAVEGVIDVILRLRETGRTICIVEHSVHFVERLADRGVFLDQGRVVAEGTMEELTTEERLVELYFGA